MIWVFPMIWKITGDGNVWQMELGFFIGLFMFVIVCLVLADLFTRLFDDTSVRFAKWLELRMIGEKTQRRLEASEVQMDTMPVPVTQASDQYSPRL